MVPSRQLLKGSRASLMEVICRCGWSTQDSKPQLTDWSEALEGYRPEPFQALS
jgi:hypothetical protein